MKDRQGEAVTIVLSEDNDNNLHTGQSKEITPP